MPSRRSFTLIELIVSISVGVIISGAAASLVWNAAKQHSEIAARSELVDTAAGAMEVMSRYIREIPQDECPLNPIPCLFGNAQVSSASARELRFGNLGFRLNGANPTVEMTRNNGANWYALAVEVNSLTFSYFDRSGNSLTAFPLSQTDRQKIRRIVTELQLSRAGQAARVRSAVYLRSFMNEVSSVP